MCFVRWARARSHCVDSIILSLGGATVTVTMRNVCARTFDTRDTRVCDCSRSQLCRRLSACVCMCDNMLDSRSAARAWIMTPTRCARAPPSWLDAHTRDLAATIIYIYRYRTEGMRRARVLTIHWKSLGRPGPAIWLCVFQSFCKCAAASLHAPTMVATTQ